MHINVGKLLRMLYLGYPPIGDLTFNSLTNVQTEEY